MREATTSSSLRTLAAPPFLIDVLAQHLAGHRAEDRDDPESLVFVGPQGGVLRRRFAERTFAPAVLKAGLDPSLTFHGLRHSAITAMVEAGVHPRVMQGRPCHLEAHHGALCPCSGVSRQAGRSGTGNLLPGGGFPRPSPWGKGSAMTTGGALSDASGGGPTTRVPAFAGGRPPLRRAVAARR